MDKFHCKSSNILNEFLKEKQRKREAKKLRETQKKTKKTPLPEQLRDVRISYCSYCNKAFTGSAYLVKHILKRHPDELLKIHSQFVNLNTRHRESDASTQPKRLYTGMEKDIMDIKETLKDFKSQVIEKLQDRDDEAAAHSKACKSSTHKVHKISKSQSEEFRRFRHELQELKLQCQNSQMTIYNLEEKHKMSLEALKHEIASNEENREQNSARIHRMVKNILRAQTKEITHVQEEVAKQLTSFRQIVTADIQKLCLECDCKLSNLKSQHISDVENLQSLLHVNVARLEKAQNEKSIERMFEQHLQNYLKKIAVNPKRKHDSRRTLLYDAFQHSPNLTSAKKSNEVSKSSHQKRKTPKMQIGQKKQEVGDTRNYQGRLSPNQQQRIENPPKYQRRITSSPKQSLSTSQKRKFKKSLFITKRVKAAMQSNPNMLDRLQEELSNVLEHKMQSFGFEPGQNRLSNSEFEAKKVLVYNDVNHSCIKDDFFSLRNKIDDLVTKKVKSYVLQNKGVKRIHFANPEFTVDSPAMSSILEEQESAEQGKLQSCKSSGFVVNNLTFSKQPKSDEQSTSPKSILEDKDIVKRKELSTVMESPIDLAETDFERINFLRNDFNSKLSLKSSSSDLSEMSSPPLQAIVVKEKPVDNVAAASNFGNKIYNQFSSVRRELKFEQGDSEATVPQNLAFSEKVTSLNAKEEEEIHELDSKSSLESLSDWDSDDDKLDVIHV